MKLGGLKVSSFFPQLIELMSMFGVIVITFRLLTIVKLVVALDGMEVVRGIVFLSFVSH